MFFASATLLTRPSLFLRPTGPPLLLRHLFSVSPQSSDAMARAHELAIEQHDALAAARPFQGKHYQWEKEYDESMKNLVSLRVGGAKVLAPVETPMMSQPEKQALHYSPVRPRDSGLCQALCASLRKLKIRKLTELQGALIPQFLRGKHVIGHSETGTGKSFGIALAACNRMLREQTTSRLHTLILVPTDALALQYERWIRHFAGSSRQVVLAAISHYPLEHQLSQLHNVQPHVLVGTPQRLAEIASLCPVIIGEKLRKKVDCIVLDEADILLKTPITPPTEADAQVASRFEQQTFGTGLGRNGGADVLSCAELIDRLYRNEVSDLPAQIVATSATFDGETALRLNTWMRNQDVVRLTTSIEEQSVPDTLSFHFVAESAAAGAAAATSSSATAFLPLHKLLHLCLQHIACQVRKPKILIFANDEEVDIQDLARYVSEMTKFPHRVIDEERSRLLREAADDDEVDGQDGNGRATTTAAAASVKKSKGSFGVDANTASRHQQRIEEQLEEQNVWRCVSLQEEDFAEKKNAPQHQHQNQHTNADRRGGGNYGRHHRPEQQQPRPIRSPLASHRRIFGRNGEIFCFNDSNLSKLDSGTNGGADIGVANYSLARGLHISGVTHVIMYGHIPGATEFLHCAGRTGRRGKSGDVVCLFSPSHGRDLKNICDTLKIPWHVNRAADVKKALLHSENECIG